MRAENRSNDNRHIFIGLGILLLAVLVVLAALLLPRALQKREMRRQITAFLADELQYITLCDPLYDTGELLVGKGKEILLDGEKTQSLQSMLAALSEGGLRQRASEKPLHALSDLRLFVKDAAGAGYFLYLNEQGLYFTKGEKAYFFQAKESAAYDALYKTLVEWLNAD